MNAIICAMDPGKKKLKNTRSLTVSHGFAFGCLVLPWVALGCLGLPWVALGCLGLPWVAVA